jgi:hypothetical protein
MQANAGVSKEIVLVLQGLVILAVAAFEATNRLPYFRKAASPPSSDGGSASDLAASGDLLSRRTPPVA